MTRDNVEILFPVDRSTCPPLSRTRKRYPHDDHASVCRLPPTSTQEGIDRSRGACHFVRDKHDASNPPRVSMHSQGHIPRRFPCSCPSDRPTFPFSSQPYPSAPFGLTDHRPLSRYSSPLPPVPVPCTPPSKTIEDPNFPPQPFHSYPLTTFFPSLSVDSSPPPPPHPSKTISSQPLCVPSPLPCQPVVTSQAHVDPSQAQASQVIHLHSCSSSPSSPPPPTLPIRTTSRLTPQYPPPIPLLPSQSPYSPTTTDGRIRLRSSPNPPVALPSPTLRPTSTGNLNANNWPLTLTRSRARRNSGSGTSTAPVTSGNDGTNSTVGQSKLRYLIQAKNSLFHSDNLHNPVGTLDTRGELRLRIALIQQRIWLVRQSKELSCPAKFRRKARAIVHPRSWRLLRELRSKLDTGPVSSMREEPGALNQRIQVLANKMIYYDGSIAEHENEDEYRSDEKDDYVDAKERPSPSESELTSMGRSSVGRRSSTSTTTPVIQEEWEGGANASESKEVVVKIVEIPPGSNAE